MESLSEQDYDIGPTPLYTALQKKKWSEAISILEQSPDEARTWVYRKEAQGIKIRWRLLPIHGAIIFQAPPEVVESILLIFPEGAAERDDEGSLPIHLAYKRGAGAPVCKLLLDAFPNSVEIADRKGRTPKHLAASSNGPKHREFVYAMKNHLLAQRAARVAARAEERLKFSTKLDILKKEQENEIAIIQQKKNSENSKLEVKIAELEQELQKTQEASQVLVEHVAAMEEKIAEQEETEKHLKVKAETLEDDLESAFKEREDEESKLKEAISLLRKELVSMQEHVEHLLLEKEVLNKSLDQVVAGAELEKKALEESNSEKEDEISRLKSDIEQKLLNEASMSQKIEALEAQIQMQASKHSSESSVSQSRFEELTEKLRKVAGFLDDMSTEQESIMEEACVHEAELQAFAKEHARILEAVDKQHEQDVKAQEARNVIMNLVETHEEEFFQNMQGRKSIVDSVGAQTSALQKGKNKRTDLVKNVSALQEKIRKTRSCILDGLEVTEDTEAEANDSVPPEQGEQREEVFGVEQESRQEREEEEESRFPQFGHDEQERDDNSEIREGESANPMTTKIGEGLEMAATEGTPMSKTLLLSPAQKNREFFAAEKKVDDAELSVSSNNDERIFAAFV